MAEPAKTAAEYCKFTGSALLPETDAKEKFCVKRPEVNCAGSYCLAWRWGKSLWKQEARPGHKVPGFPNDGAGPEFVEREGATRMSTYWNGVKPPEEIKLGYCGLAGAPTNG